MLGKIIGREIYVVEEKLKKKYEEGQNNSGLVGLACVSMAGGIPLTHQE